MNIKGLSQYSKATTGIRRPDKIFQNSNFKLVFVYPMLVSDKIQNIGSIETTIRDFVSVTFLKELFIENTINIISMANQIRPISDESGQQIDPFVAIAQALGRRSAGYDITDLSKHPPNYTVSSQYRYELQQKIKEKTAVIYQYTKTDPKLSKLRPYIEIITMGNLIDVPVIIGTKVFRVNTLALLHILIASISLKRSLTSIDNLNFICDELSKLDETRYWSLLRNLNPPIPGAFKTWYQNQLTKFHNAISSISARARGAMPVVIQRHTAMRRLGTQTPGVAQQTQTPGVAQQTPTQFEEDSIFQVLKVVKDNLDEAKLFFRMVLDPSLLRTQFGVNISSEDSLRSGIVSELSSELNRIRGSIISDFIAISNNYGLGFLRSAANSVMPNPAPVDIDLLDLINQYFNNDLIDRLNDGIQNFLSDFKSSFEKTKYNVMSDSIGEIREFCRQSYKFEHINNFELLPGFTTQQFTDFVNILDRFASECSVNSKNLETLIRKFDDSLMGALGNIKAAISNSIRQIFNVLQSRYNMQQNTVPEVCMRIQGLTVNVVVSNFIPSLVNHLTEIFYFIFLASVQKAICNFVVLANVQLERSTSEVTSWPNYILVLPVEIITALHTAIISKSWKELTTVDQGGTRVPATREAIQQTGVTVVSENYIKGIVKFVSMRLQIPNLFVIDSKNGDVYYQLMYQTGINKTKLNTLETFVKATLNKSITDQQQIY
jgi:hypothetical protein